MTNDPRRHAARNLGWFLILGGSVSAALPAQLVPKTLGDATKNTVPTRPDGRWRGQAQETIGEGNKLEYEIDLAFTGPDDKLQQRLQEVIDHLYARPERTAEQERALATFRGLLER